MRVVAATVKKSKAKKKLGVVMKKATKKIESTTRSEVVTIRVGEELLNKLDFYAEELTRRFGVNFSRTNVILELLEKGNEVFEKDRKIHYPKKAS